MNFFARAAWALARVRGLAAGVVLALAASHGAAAQCPDFCDPSCPEYDPCACFGPCSAGCGQSKCDPGCPGYDPCFCDPMMCDDDGDGVPNSEDFCPWEPGPCGGCPAGVCGCGYPDIDGDGVEDCVDNCPNQWNPNQLDSDGDGLGDDCDACPWGTDFCNPSCPDYDQFLCDPCSWPGSRCDPSCPNFDPCWCYGWCHPGCPDHGTCLCDPMMCDDDGDGVPNIVDPCPQTFGTCEGCPEGPCGCSPSDIDADGVPDCVDNCPKSWNADQQDQDGDGIGDSCDACPWGADFCNPSCPDYNPCLCDPCACAGPSPCDFDGDGIPNEFDNCPKSAGSSECGGCPFNECGLCTEQWEFPDCNWNGVDDRCELINGSAADCDGNGALDQCDIAWGYASDCNANGVPDSCEIVSGAAQDCDGNGRPDSCDIASGYTSDCDANGIPDSCDLASGGAADCNQNGISDACELAWGWQQDCNGNGRLDSCDIVTGKAGAELVTNGGFEEASFTGCPNVCATSCGFGLPAWTRGGLITEDLCRNITSCIMPNPVGGEYVISLQGSVCCGCDNNGWISQTVATESGRRYQFQMDIFLDEFDAIRVSYGGQSVDFTPTDYGSGVWSRVTWVVDGTGSAEDLVIASVGTSDTPSCLGADNAYIDNISLRAVGGSTDCDGNGVPDECDVVSGADCNGNGVPDACDIASGIAGDCNSNGFPDSCEIAWGILEDCNQNGVSDACEKQVAVSLFSGRLAPVGFANPHTWVISNAVRAVGGVGSAVGNQEVVFIYFSALGDFSGTLEYVRCTVGGMFTEILFAGGMTPDCSEVGFGLYIPLEQFNAAIGADGALRIVMQPSIAVDAALCDGDTWIEARIEYIGAASSDCNANGLLDSCEIAAGYAPDSNGNGIIDACESPLAPCRVDFDGSGSVDGADLGLLLAAWSSSTPAFDLNSDGIVDGADMGLMLAAWGSCDN